MENLAEKLVAEFLTGYRTNGSYLRECVTSLVKLAISEDDTVAELATRAVFTSLVERLADSFEPGSVTLYNRVFAQIIQQCRQDPRAELLDDRLEEFGLRSEADLIARTQTLRLVPNLRATGTRLRVIVLSRVTLGADVAITSVILERIKRAFPGAEIVLVGGRKAAQLFGGDRRVGFKEIAYLRAGTTIGRLLTWVELLECVRELTHGLKPGEYLIIDPDTRITQLGLLPITPVLERSRPRFAPDGEDPASAPEGPDYLFFPSREYGGSTSQSLGELTSAWIGEVFGESATTYPRVILSHDDILTGRRLIKRMKRSLQPIVAINFGVGENQFKRVGGDFEASLVGRLIQDGNRIVLDKGAGKDETSRVDAVIAQVTCIERDGRRVRATEIDERGSRGEPEEPGAEILVWNGRIGLLAALIAESDLYVGYDSAGQHIASALGVPCIDVFAGFSSPRMIERWRPTGEAETRVIAVEESSGANTSELIERVLSHSRKLLR
jgi:ADP-heptose:LPS heptosyltransferase